MKVVLFDLDGTLVRAGRSGARALDRAVEKLHGVSGVCERLNFQGKTDLRNFSEAIREALGRRPAPGEVERVHREYLRLLPASVRESVRSGRYENTRGIEKFLERLSLERDVLLGLGTGNMEQGAWIKLKPSGLSRYFRFGGFGCDSYHRHELLRKGVVRAGAFSGGRRILRKNVWIIGDTPLDVAAGRRAGYRTAAVGTGFACWEDLKASRPDFLARDFRNIRTWFQRLGLSKTR